jgi:hypothetical protein
VPSTATPIALPTWRMAWIRPDPTPLRSVDSAPSAAFMAGGRVKPSPTPATETHAAT